LHIHGETVAIQEDASVIVNYINYNYRLVGVTRSSDSAHLTVAVNQIGYIVPQAPAGPPATP
jgi:hypothetical protein